MVAFVKEIDTLCREVVTVMILVTRQPVPAIVVEAKESEAEGAAET